MSTEQAKQTRVCDFLVLGAGGGLVGALAARSLGLDCLVLERSASIGGSTALSGGTLWIPASRPQFAAGVQDSAELAERYLSHLVSDEGPWCGPERRSAYVRGAPALVELLERYGVKFYYADGWTDYYADAPGGLVRGRTLGVRPFDARLLGDAAAWLRPGGLGLPANSVELSFLALGGRTWKSRKTALRVAARAFTARVRGQRLLVRGQSLIGQVLAALLAERVPIWREARVRSLIMRGGRVCGAVAEYEGREWHIEARKGVLLATGGYARNPTLRSQFQPSITGEWSLASPDDIGEGLALGREVGGATAVLDEAWWAPCTRLPTHAMGHVWDRCFPHSIIVDARGDRFMNEAAPYMEAGQAMIRHARVTGTLRSWILLEHRHRSRYAFGMAPPRMTPREWFESGYLKRAMSVEELARACEIDPARLQATLNRFNEFARRGRDEDFGRGEHAFARYYSDSSVKPNPNLGAIERPPFYAAAIYPGDVGTAGGLVADEHARVLRADGAPVEGLYAAGNCAAPVFGRSYPGAGASIAASMVFAVLAATHAAGAAESRRAKVA
jgi:3-oxosteroid 1-dehydrogenase